MRPGDITVRVEIESEDGKAFAEIQVSKWKLDSGSVKPVDLLAYEVKTLGEAAIQRFLAETGRATR